MCHFVIFAGSLSQCTASTQACDEGQRQISELGKKLYVVISTVCRHQHVMYCFKAVELFGHLQFYCQVTRLSRMNSFSLSLIFWQSLHNFWIPHRPQKFWLAK